MSSTAVPTIRERAHNIAEAVMVHLVIEVSKDPRVKENEQMFGAVLAEYQREIDAWQRDLEKTPQNVVEIFAKAGVIVDRIE